MMPGHTFVGHSGLRSRPVACSSMRGQEQSYQLLRVSVSDRLHSSRTPMAVKKLVRSVMPSIATTSNRASGEEGQSRATLWVLKSHRPSRQMSGLVATCGCAIKNRLCWIGGGVRMVSSSLKDLHHLKAAPIQIATVFWRQESRLIGGFPRL